MNTAASEGNSSSRSNETTRSASTLITRCPAVLCRRAGISAAEAPSCGVTKMRSAFFAAKTWPGRLRASAATTDCPCGDRGVMDGPLTEKNRPSKSM
ncbi:Uncharacterised protein [Mycobacteroides abscessus subsp. abscessus]|nr:Uncharacterised protein [Mycobacteroides abscessus subsp. abscessus]